MINKKTILKPNFYDSKIVFIFYILISFSSESFVVSFSEICSLFKSTFFVYSFSFELEFIFVSSIGTNFLSGLLKYIIPIIAPIIITMLIK